jgi:predicted nucleic acid-binding protein
VKYLLDVNVLIASIWTDHASHTLVDAWIRGKTLATCAISELGFLRISTHPKALAARMEDARKLLGDFLVKHEAELVPADLAVLISTAPKSDLVTDFYLAELAASKGMKLATLDTGVSHPAVEVIK